MATIAITVCRRTLRDLEAFGAGPPQGLGHGPTVATASERAGDGSDRLPGAAVDTQPLTGDVRRRVGDHEAHDPRDLVG